MYTNCSFGVRIIKLFSLSNFFFVNSIMNIWKSCYIYRGQYFHDIRQGSINILIETSGQTAWWCMVLLCDCRALSKMAWKLLGQKPLQKLNLVVVEVYGMGNLVAAFIYTWPSYHYKILVNSLKVIWNFG